MNTLISSWGITLIYLALLLCGIIYAIFIGIGASLGSLHIPGIDLHIDTRGHDIGIGHDVGAGHVDIGSGHAEVGGGGASVDHPTIKIPSLSPITIASFVTAFGAFGLISMSLFNATAKFSLAWATAGGLIVAVIAHFAFGYFLIAPQGSSEVRLQDIVGSSAEVVTPIPADSVGEIALVAQGGRFTYTAKSSTGIPIPRGATVDIEKIVGGVAVVKISSEHGG